MIVRDRPSGFKLLWIVRGSVLQRIKGVLAVNIVLAIIVTVAHGTLFHTKIPITPIPFTLIGLPLAIFLGFRNNTAYARYWEGRKLWGEIVIYARTLARQCLSLIELDHPIDPRQRANDVRVRMVHRAVAFSHVLRAQLRALKDDVAAQQWLTHAEWQRLQQLPLNQRTDALMLAMGKDLGQCVRDRRIDPCLAVELDRTLNGFTTAAASCERIRNTPIPFSYTLLLHRTAHLYCFLLPFGLVDITGFMTPFVVAIVAYTFYGLDVLGDELEEPFGMESNDLALDSICRSIEISLSQSLGDPQVPEPLKPVDYLLT
ncbi:bestrophin family protein [Comamonas testosteroni]|uniref:bestrophin family protein n=1 Tax=Comamonas testosteroni TaxID=285 RepID=UPI00265EB313|nr:bestrophin family protein [Comamonas testosteroni]WKL17358.1 bestrophin family protein [Comamonas testosteroni]